MPSKLLELLGKGGMGEVYRAKDSKLDRDVAIKVLPEEFARDEERLVRIQREAKLLASLDHPHIAAIHGFQTVEEQGEPVHFLVLEYGQVSRNGGTNALWSPGGTKLYFNTRRTRMVVK